MNNYTISSSKGAGALHTFEPEVQPVELFLDGEWVDSIGDRSVKLYLVTLKRKSKASIEADSFEIEEGRIQFKSESKRAISWDTYRFSKTEYIPQFTKEEIEEVKVSEKIAEKFASHKENGINIEGSKLEMYDSSKHEVVNPETLKRPARNNPAAEIGFPEEMVKQIDDYLSEIAKTRMQGLTSEPTLVDPFPTKIDLPDTIAFDQAFYKRKMKKPTETETD